MDAIVELIDEEIRPYHCTIKSKQLGDLIAILQNKRQAVELSLDSKTRPKSTLQPQKTGPKSAIRPQKTGPKSALQPHF